MTSSIIGDAKYQELNMSFSFDEQQDKFTIKAIADHTPYQLQLAPNPDLDFEDLKSVLLAKQFKLTSRTPDLLKLKIGVTFFEFKNIEKLTLNTLKQTISDLSSKLEVQSQRNSSLQATVNKMKSEFDLMTTKMADLSRMNDERSEQNVRISKELAQVKESIKESEKKLDKVNNIVNELREEARQLKTKIKLSEGKLQSVTQNFTNKIKKIQEMIKMLLDQNKMQRQKLEQMQRMKQVSLQNNRYKFSSQQKGNEISLSKNNSTATRQLKDKRRDIALVEGTVCKKGSLIRFKIESVGTSISGVGLAIRNVIVANQYHFQNRNNLGDGYFLICFGGWSFSNSNKQHNDVSTNFRLEKGDTVKVETNGDELLFWNETKKLEYKMKMILTQDEWKEVRFCVSLLQLGDSMSILSQ